ncbi:hypothetical protein OIV83_005728 [Microbotryomycetes sp. JL201]|nr:hypothetical protein OIV83_005728 [Microbotryomycetes sp. JL201]
MSYPPRSTPPRSDSLQRSQRSGATSSSSQSPAPAYQLQDLPLTSSTTNNSSRQRLPAGAGASVAAHAPNGGTTSSRDYAYDETDPLTAGYGTQSPDMAFSDAPYTSGHHGHAGSLDLTDAYIHTQDATQDDNDAYHGMRTEPSMATIDSSSPLQPIRPGAAVQMHSSVPMTSKPLSAAAQSSAAAAAGGANSANNSRPSSILNEKQGGYRSPRARSRDRLGNWSGPAGFGNSPYGPLGNGGSTPGSGLQSANSSNPNLLFAEGDWVPPPTNKFAKLVFAIYDSSFIVRWIIYIIPVLALLWIPAIIQFTAAPNGTIWTVPLLWWSIWLSVVWVGWWGAALASRIVPKLLQYTIGVIAPELNHYILYVKAIRFYVGAAAWALVNWISFLPVVRSRATASTSNNTLSLITQGLFGIWLCLAILLIEKLCIQIIAHNFHKKSYEDRITEQKFQVRALAALYANTRDLGRTDTLDGGINPTRPKNKRQHSDPTLLVKSALKGVKKAAQTATTVIGTVASEIAGENVLKPNSAPSMVIQALQSSKKSKHLARRIFYSFCPSYRTSLVLADVSRCFPDRDTADRAFAMFDRDGNGDATLEEIELSVVDCHRERLALSRSMRDIDSAVGRLDNIIMSVWWIVSALIMAGLLNASFNTMITSAGTLILGLSWLIGTTAQEILASIIFLFIKHAYDVGDRVDIDGNSYTVLEMQLLSSVFKRIDGTVVQAPHSILNTKFINNIRRSGAIWEPFVFDVAFDTPFEKIEALRERMLEFLEVERRDFLPQCDITVQNFEGQGKTTLSANIMYRSNWQNGTLKAQRRNKWICAMKLAMASLQIYGPGGAGDPAPAPADITRTTTVPWNEAKHLFEPADKKDDGTVADETVKSPVSAEAPTRGDVLRSGRAIQLSDPNEVFEDEAGPFDDARRGREQAREARRRAGNAAVSAQSRI